MRVTCRCGERLSVPVDGPDRVVCPKCSARIRVRRDNAQAGAGDGFVRFACPCGRRLKVKAEGTPKAGRCPDCGRVVPVPSPGSSSTLSPGQAEAPTEDLSPADLALLEQWSERHLGQATQAAGPSTTVRAEAGLRVCPGCGKPVHMGASACRECGTHVPKR
jgi:hypothetical protein